MSNPAVVTYLSPFARGVPCSYLRDHAADIAHNIGYESTGIQKGSFAAEGMSREARACGGGVPKMVDGGVSASLQSIGATGYIKPAAEQATSYALARAGMKTMGGPEQLR